MKQCGPGDKPDTIRIDRLLVNLRFARTRSAARAMIESNALRCNRRHVHRVSEKVRVGDVLTLVQTSARAGVNAGEVRIVEVLALPERRASPAAAKTFYREHARS